MRRIHFSNITAYECKASAGFIYGLPEMPIEEVTFDNIVITVNGDPTFDGAKLAMIQGLPKMREEFSLQEFKNVKFSDVKIHGVRAESALKIENAENVRIEGLEAYGSPVAIEFKNVRNALIMRCTSSNVNEYFLSVDGGSTQNILLMENNLINLKRPIRLANDVNPNAVTIK